MPYLTNDDLPKKVKDHLPAHAQDIYRAAFNHAWVTIQINKKQEGSI